MSKQSVALKFTLTELLVVIGIIAVLASLGLIAMTSSRDTVLRAKAMSDIKNLYLAIESFKAEYGDYPAPENAVAGFDRRITCSRYTTKKTDELGPTAGDDHLGVDSMTAADNNPILWKLTHRDKNGDGQIYNSEISNDFSYDRVDIKDKNDANANINEYVDPWGRPYRYMLWADVQNAEGAGVPATEDQFSEVAAPYDIAIYSTGGKDNDSDNDGIPDFWKMHGKLGAVFVPLK